MRSFNSKPLAVLFLFAALISVLSCSRKEDAPRSPSTPLTDYVRSRDADFKYEILGTLKKDHFTYYVARMTSQQWLTTDEVNTPEWWHWVSVIVPDDCTYKTGMMWIGGGTKDDAMPSEPNKLMMSISDSTHSIVAYVHNIPFQPLVFANDTVHRYEDAIIAYGWRKFLEGGAKDQDAIWLSRLPMTRAVVSAMDVVQDILEQKQQMSVDHFVVAGASKRGWTTWITAATDDRVVAIVPVVIDLLNIRPSFQHHWRNYGSWAPAVGDYEREGIMDWMGSKEYDRLLEIEEPYSYKSTYVMPKLLINAADDEFFLPDSWKFYYHDLPGEKHLMYVPNSGHDVSGSDALRNLTAFYSRVLDNQPRPDYTWTINGDVFEIKTNPASGPVAIKLWSAHNNDRRDFRMDVLGPKWTATDLALNANGVYTIPIATPEKGWTGYFVELTYPGRMALKVTTGVEVLPKKYPFDSFSPSVPKGSR